MEPDDLARDMEAATGRSQTGAKGSPTIAMPEVWGDIVPKVGKWPALLRMDPHMS